MVNNTIHHRFVWTTWPKALWPRGIMGLGTGQTIMTLNHDITFQLRRFGFLALLSEGDNDKVDRAELCRNLPHPSLITSDSHTVCIKKFACRFRTFKLMVMSCERSAFFQFIICCGRWFSCCVETFSLCSLSQSQILFRMLVRDYAKHHYKRRLFTSAYNSETEERL